VEEVKRRRGIITHYEESGSLVREDEDYSERRGQCKLLGRVASSIEQLGSAEME